MPIVKVIDIVCGLVLWVLHSGSCWNGREGLFKVEVIGVEPLNDTNGMRPCSTPVTCTWNIPLSHFNMPQKTGLAVSAGIHSLCLQPQQLIGMKSCNITNFVPYILAAIYNLNSW